MKNYEQLYEKYKNGTATDEEKAYVEREIEKAKRICDLLDEQPQPTSEAIVSKEVDDALVQKARKSFNHKHTIRTIIIVICIVALIIVLGFAAVFGTAFFGANGSETITREQAKENAILCIADYTGQDASAFFVSEIDKELTLDAHLGDSVYIYEVEVEDGWNSYQVNVNAASGYAHIVDIDMEYGYHHGGRHGYQNAGSGTSARSANAGANCIYADVLCLRR